jgi:hypothetical protein
MNVRTTESRGHRISYEDAGEGPAIVSVNGTASPAAEWRDGGYVDRLVGEFRVVSVDSLGHGQSATPHEWEAYRAPAIATDIVAATDAAGVERAALWGYSPVDVSAEDRRYLEESSDPKALGAVDLGTRRSQYVIDLGHLRAPASWDAYFSAFEDSDAVLPPVLAHLRSIGEF